MSDAADMLERIIYDLVQSGRPEAIPDIDYLLNVAELLRSLTPYTFLTGEKYCELCACSLAPDSEGHEDDCLLKKLEEAAKP